MARPLLRPDDLVGSFKDLEVALHNLSSENLTKDAVTTQVLKDAQVTLAKLADEVRRQIMLDGW